MAEIIEAKIISQTASWTKANDSQDIYRVFLTKDHVSSINQVKNNLGDSRQDPIKLSEAPAPNNIETISKNSWTKLGALE